MKRIFAIILTVSLFFFNSVQARTVCHYKVTTITENNQIKGHREEKTVRKQKLLAIKLVLLNLLFLVLNTKQL